MAASIRIETVLVRLGAIVVVVNAFRNVAYHSVYFFNPDAPLGPFLVNVGLTFFMPCAIAMFLWLFPAKVLRNGSNGHASDYSSGITADQLLVVGILLLGLYATAFGVIDLIYFEAQRFAEYRYVEAYELDRHDPSPATTAGRVTNIAQIIFGLILIFGRRGMSRLLYKIRYAGVDAS